MGQRHDNLYRTFIICVLMTITVSTLMTCFTGSCVHWVSAAAAILVLYRIVRGADR